MKKISKRIFGAMLALSLVLGTAFANPQLNASAAARAVTDVKQTKGDSTYVKLEYNAVAGVRYYGYNLYDAAGNFILSGDASDTYASIRNLSQGQTYYVDIICYSDYKHTAALGSTRAEVVTAPSVTSGTTYKQTDFAADSATLSWNPVAGATSYTVVYYFDRNQQMSASTATNSIVLPLMPNIEYSAYVYACRSNSTGTYTATSDYSMSVDYSINNNYYIASLPTFSGVISSSFYSSSLSLDVEGEKSPTADGYYYEIYDHKGSSLITSAESDSSYGYCSVAFRKSDRYKVFYVTAKPYIIDGNGVKHYSNASSQYIANSIKADLTSKKSKQINVKWTKISGIDRYVVYAAKGKADDIGKYKKVATVKGKKNSYTLKKIGKKKLSSKKKYSVCVYGQKKINGEYVDISVPVYYSYITCK